MSDHDSGKRSSVGLFDIASQVPGLLMDAPTILRGLATGLLARPTSKASIGKVFQDRAARYGGRVFLRFGDQQLTYRDANGTANRYAAVLAARGVVGSASWSEDPAATASCGGVEVGPALGAGFAATGSGCVAGGAGSGCVADGATSGVVASTGSSSRTDPG